MLSNEPVQEYEESAERNIRMTKTSATSTYSSQNERMPSHHSDPIDKGVFECLCTLQRKSSSNVLGKVLRIYLADSANLLASLRESIGAGDDHGTRNAAHSLTSSSSAIGALTLAALCRALESSCERPSRKDEREMMKRIEEEYGRVQETLREELQRRSL